MKAKHVVFISLMNIASFNAQNANFLVDTEPNLHELLEPDSKQHYNKSSFDLVDAQWHNVTASLLSPRESILWCTHCASGNNRVDEITEGEFRMKNYSPNHVAILLFCTCPLLHLHSTFKLPHISSSCTRSSVFKYREYGLHHAYEIISIFKGELLSQLTFVWLLKLRRGRSSSNANPISLWPRCTRINSSDHNSPYQLQIIGEHPNNMKCI